MQKITFHNDVNGLECSFATDTPSALLSAFDGNSLGAEFEQFKTVGYDGAKTFSHTLSARTITFTADWYGVRGGKYSRSEALAKWEKLQWTFNIGDVGTLTWTNGTDTRTIECYAAEIPALHEKVRGLFSADFTLTADYPLWQGSVIHSITFDGQRHNDPVELENTCPISVPPFITIEGGGAVEMHRSAMNGNAYSGAWLEVDPQRLNDPSGTIYIDNARHRVYKYYGLEPSAVNVCLSPDSSFFSLYPGINKILLTMNDGAHKGTTVTFNWRDHYMGVSK